MFNRKQEEENQGWDWMDRAVQVARVYEADASPEHRLMLQALIMYCLDKFVARSNTPLSFELDRYIARLKGNSRAAPRPPPTSVPGPGVSRNSP